MSQHVYPAGGWLPEGAHFELKWDDQGRDFATNWGGMIQAPGNGVCLAVLSDGPFPNGFGPDYPVVRIDTGPWAGHEYYIGHNSTAVSPGQSFGFGAVLAHANQGQNWAGTTGGWVELGEAFGGLPGPKEASHWYDHLISVPMIVNVPDPDPYVNFPTTPFRLLGKNLNENWEVRQWDQNWPLRAKRPNYQRLTQLYPELKELRDRIWFVAHYDNVGGHWVAKRQADWFTGHRNFRWHAINDRLNAYRAYKPK